MMEGSFRGWSVLENVLLITTYENMHSCKPSPRYYLEIAEKIGRKPNECIMVGNDADADIVPAMKAGLRTFYLARGDGDDKTVAADYRGTLRDFREVIWSWPSPSAVRLE